MARITLATMITEGKVVKAICPRCRGNVTLPTEVFKLHYRTGYAPEGQCHRCGVTWEWRTRENPAGGTAVYPQDKGKYDVWFCDRVLDAPAPRIVE